MAEYIDRQAVLNNIAGIRAEHSLKDDEKMVFLETDIAGLLLCAPEADVAPVQHGKWLDMQEDDTTEGMWRCSACGEDRYFYEGHPIEYGFKFCPNCGARMDLGGVGRDETR